MCYRVYVIEFVVLNCVFVFVPFSFVLLCVCFLSGGGLLLFVCLFFFYLFPFCPSPANCNASALTYCIIVRGTDACALIGAFVQNWVASIFGDFGANNRFTWKWHCFHYWVSQNSLQATSRKAEAYNVTITGCKLVSHWKLFFKLACCAASDKKITSCL